MEVTGLAHSARYAECANVGWFDLVVATETNPHYLDRLQTTFAHRSNVIIQPLDLNRHLPEWIDQHGLDTVVCCNVLEHIKDDEATLRNFSRMLSTNGRIVLVIPALQRLYGEIDKAIHHYRGWAAKTSTSRAPIHIESG